MLRNCGSISIFGARNSILDLEAYNTQTTGLLCGTPFACALVMTSSLLDPMVSSESKRLKCDALGSDAMSDG